MRLLRRRTSFSQGRETDKKVKSEIPMLKIGDLSDFFALKVSFIKYNFALGYYTYTYETSRISFWYSAVNAANGL
ncbi:hypothetical protein GCM10011418_43230 [Sphingobacterium alkalisoli]|nr:hypothetical protein GCM10011418_43230 [Sphingobacterium alkalisoli]